MAYNPQNPNGQATMANSAPVVIASDQSAVQTTATATITQTDAFDQIVTSTRYNQIEVDFSSTAPASLTDYITVTTSNGGSSSNSNGQAVFASGTNASGNVQAVSVLNIDYRPHAENYAAFTAIFTVGIPDSWQRIGPYDGNNGFFIGYEGADFGVTIRKATVDTTILQTNWNVDTLTGAAGSKYTLNGAPVSFDSTKDNLFRIRFGWLGAANVNFEIYSPDGQWVVFHVYKVANQQTSPTVNSPNLPLTLHVRKMGADSTNLIMSTACWGAGSSSSLSPIDATLSNKTLAQVTRSVITGQTTGGGGGFVNVKVNPSGSLVTATTLDAGTNAIGSITNTSFIATQATAANLNATVVGTVTANISGSISNTAFGVNNGSGASAVNIQDGGNSITVDGTVAATQSGTWDIGTLTSITNAVTVSQSTATSLKTQAENYQGGSAVGTSNPLQVTLANTGTNTNAIAVKSTSKFSIGSTTTMTVTNLHSLASSATAGWQSDRVSNLTTLARDYEICVKLVSANTAPANDKAMYVYLCPFYTTDGGTTWLASSQGTATLPTGTQGTTTIATPNNLRLLGILNYTTQNSTVQDTFLLSNCFGDRMPDGFSIIIINFSGAALAAAGNAVYYTPINDTLV